VTYGRQRGVQPITERRSDVTLDWIAATLCVNEACNLSTPGGLRRRLLYWWGGS